MDNILVLVDFTETATISMMQAIEIAKTKNSSISICHIIESDHGESSDLAVQEKLQPYVDLAKEAGVKVKTILGHGNLFTETAEIVESVHPDVVVVGTHGIRGLKQNLFGSFIYKLVKEIKAPTLIVSDKTKVVPGGFKEIMMPVAPHKDYLLKVVHTASLVAKEGKITIFAIVKPGAPLSEQIISNISATKNHLDKIGIAWEYLEIESNKFSVGYSKETLEVVDQKQMDMISIMVNVSSPNAFFGKVDKESTILNDLGIPVLCTNQPF